MDADSVAISLSFFLSPPPHVSGNTLNFVQFTLTAAGHAPAWLDAVKHEP